MSDKPHIASRWSAWERWSCVLLPATLALALGLGYIFGERWGDTPYYQAISMYTVRQGGQAWWTLHEGAVHYFNKPPLAFWIHAACVRVFGEVDWAYRVPELVWYVLTCVLVASLAKRLHGWRIGLCAGVAMALTDEWIWRVGNFRLEFLLTLLLVGALRCWVEAFGLGKDGDGSCDRFAAAFSGSLCEPPSTPAQVAPAKRRSTCGTMKCRVWWAVGAGVCIGLALLTKPLIGLALPALAAAWLLLIRRLDWRAVALLALSICVALAVALPWHVSMAMQHGRAFTDAYFVNQAYKRATGQMFEPEPWWWYFTYAVDQGRMRAGPEKMWFIYGLAIGGVVLILARLFPKPRRVGDVLALLYTVGWIVALSAFSDKRNYYALVIHPGTAWLAGRLVGSVVPIPVIRWGSVAGMCVALALLVHTVTDVPRTRERVSLTPERAALMDFVRAHAHEPIYNGGLTYPDAALIYIYTRVWPRHFMEKATVPPERIPAGALAIYREDQFTRPGNPARVDRSDEVVFTARGAGPERDYLVVRRGGESGAGAGGSGPAR